MPLKIVKVEQLTRPTRQKQSVVTSLPEFVEATLKLSHGLKPQEGIEITLPKKDERGYKHIAFGMKKHLRFASSSARNAARRSCSACFNRWRSSSSFCWRLNSAAKPPLALSLTRTNPPPPTTKAQSRRQNLPLERKLVTMRATPF